MSWKYLFLPKPPPSIISLIEESLDTSRRELFQVRLEKEAAIATEAKLIERIARLEKEEKEHAEKREMQRNQ